jgi:predicted RecB family endonuclease
MMIEAPEGHRWQVTLTNWELSVSLLTAPGGNPNGERVAVESKTGAFDMAYADQLVNGMAVRILSRMEKAKRLADTLGVEVLFR